MFCFCFVLKENLTLLYGKSDAGLKIQGKRLKKTDPYRIFPTLIQESQRSVHWLGNDL